MGEPRVNYANEIRQRRQTLYDFTYMNVESEKTKHVNKGWQNRNRLVDTESQQGAARGQRAGGQVGEASETKRARLLASQ